MNRRGFLRNLGMLPAATFLPSISVAQAAPVAPALCPMAWDKFYDFAKRASDYYAEDPIPMLLISKRFMERHPVWFKPEYMMTGPSSVINETRGKVVLTVLTRALRTERNLTPPKETWSGLLEEIQDTKAVGSLLGKQLVDLVDEAADEVNAEWLEIKKRFPGAIICSYIPLQSTRWTKHAYHTIIGFKTRYGIWNAQHHSGALA